MTNLNETKLGIISFPDPDPFIVSFQEAGKISFYKDGRVVCELTNPDEATKQFVAFVETNYRAAIIEAEQRGYERARAECAADTRRLEWLERQPFTMLQLFDQGWTVSTDQIERSFGKHTARNAIDAAMEGGK